MKVTILDDYFDTLRGLPCFNKLAEHGVTVWNDHLQETDPLAARLKDSEALVLFRERTKIGSDLLERLPKLKLISQRSVYPHVDVEACTQNGVLLCSNMHAGTPSYAAAEMTFGLILAAMRQIPQQMAALQAGTWQIGVGHTLRGKRIGIYSYGRIGKAVANYAKAFGMHVLVHGGEVSSRAAHEDGFEVVTDRQTFFSSCDIISLHIRLKPTTREIITNDDLDQMHSKALLINTSRAGLIQRGALLAALKAGRPGMAAIDVFDQEPVLEANDPLLELPNIVVTPHIGYVTEEEYELQFGDIFDQIVAFDEGSPINMINPEVLKTWAS